MTEGTYTTNSSDAAFNYTVPADTNDRIGFYFYSIGGLQGTTLPTSVAATIGGNALTSLGAPVSDIGTRGVAIYGFYILDADMPAPGAQSVVVTVAGGSPRAGIVQCMV